jgi:hypothetical protein
MAQKIKVTCAILDIKTDDVISERVIGEYDTVDAASFAGHRARLDGESVVLYGCPKAEEEDLTPAEIAEIETAWSEYAKF